MRKRVIRSSTKPCQLDHINKQLYQIFRTCQVRCQTLSALRELADLLEACAEGENRPASKDLSPLLRMPSLCNNALIYRCVFRSLLNGFSEEVGL